MIYISILLFTIIPFVDAVEKQLNNSEGLYKK